MKMLLNLMVLARLSIHFEVGRLEANENLLINHFQVRNILIRNGVNPQFQFKC